VNSARPSATPRWKPEPRRKARRRGRARQLKGAYTIDAATTANTLTARSLWELLFGDLEGYMFTLTGKQNPHDRGSLISVRQLAWEWPGESDEAADYLLEHSGDGRDAYFGVHLFRTCSGRTKENAAEEVLALWVDGDGAHVPSDWPQPTVTVESSPGRHHFYWKLTRAISAGQAAQLNRRLCYGMGGDKGKWGLGTVLRAPGTRNYKRETPHEVRSMPYG
jgi:hypothetical protein